jgi:hypothetical protein
MDSIMQSSKRCYKTGDTQGLHKHHIYFGNPRKKISERNGFWVWLRADWHNEADYGVHFDHAFDLKLKRECQEKFEETHSREEFRRLIGKSYL